jgi:lactoylglutathione lyase
MNLLIIFEANYYPMDHLVQTIGFISALLTTSAFLPQAIKTWRTRSTSDLSPLMFALFCVGILGWLIYGILIHDLPIILANSVTICLAGTIMFFILRGQDSTEIAHVGLYAEDLENMKEFYCETFNARAGKKYTNPEKKFSSYFIRFPSGARLEIMHQKNLAGNPEKDQLGHLAISVGSKSSVDLITRSLRNKAVTIFSEPRYTGNGYYESVIADPEGNRIEITI